MPIDANTIGGQQFWENRQGNLINDWLISRARQPHPVTQLMPSFQEWAKSALGSGLRLAGQAGEATQGNLQVPSSTFMDVANILPLTGLFGAGGKLALAANAPKAAPFFSALSKGVEAAPLTQAPGSQWLGTIKNTPGIKQEELDWIGVPEWLQSQKGPVTKQQLSDFIRANQVDVQEVVKGTRTSSKGEWTPEKSARLDDLEERSRRGAISDAEDAERQALIDEELSVMQAGEAGTPQDMPKFSQYQLPGGENYRELLLTLPDKAPQRGPVPPDVARVAEVSGESPDTIAISRINDLERRGFITQAQANAAELWRLGKSEDSLASGNFRGGHYDEPNVLAHVRFNDRVDAAGKKTLFIEEIQSDWHQKGRKQGYQVPLRPDAMALGNPNKPGMVPDAPFKSSWPELALKRMVKWAADNGYDQVAWTPGKVQAERYDLSKHLDRVTALDKGDGVWSIQGHVNNLPVLTKNNVPEAQLADVVGKELADKIIGKKGNIVSGNGNLRAYSGLDLQVGGEGMKAFYDKMLVDKANKLGKKYGAKVGVTRVDPVSESARGYHVDRVTGGRRWAIRDMHGVVVGESYATRQGADAALRSKQGLFDGDATEVWSLPITDAMRKEAGARGMPLFTSGAPMPLNADTLGQQQQLTPEQAQAYLRGKLL